MKFSLCCLPYIVVLFFLHSFQLVYAQDKSSFKIPRSTVVDIKDPNSGRVYPLFIKLPRSYRYNSDKSYPVIYSTDALYSFQIISGATRFPMNTGKIQEAIIVGLSYSKGSTGHSSRVRDYTHTENKRWKNKTGEAKQYANFIKKFVFSYIEKNYRVNETRIFVGNSLGGLLGAHIFFTSPEMFNSYILGSPSVWFKNNDILNIETQLNQRQHKVFIAVGANETPEFDSPNHDMVSGAKKLKLKMSGDNFPNTEIKLLIIDGANHETAFPTTAIQGLYWLLKQ